MLWIVVRHKVKDYAVWKPLFDTDIPEQKAAGLQIMEIDRNVDDPSELFLVFQAEDLAKAKAFYADPRLKEVMIKGGVADEPSLFFMETVESYMKPPA